MHSTSSTVNMPSRGGGSRPSTPEADLDVLEELLAAEELAGDVRADVHEVAARPASRLNIS
jgi:hypothetical protein